MAVARVIGGASCGVGRGVRRPREVVWIPQGFVCIALAARCNATSYSFAAAVVSFFRSSSYKQLGFNELTWGVDAMVTNWVINLQLKK